MKRLPDSTLKDGSTVQLFFCDMLADCPAVPMMLRAFAELLEKGWSLENFAPFTNTNNMIWAEIDGKIVSAIMFSKHQDTSHAWIIMSYTEPEARGRGLIRIIHRFLEIETRASKLRYIGSMVHPENTVRLGTLAKLGFKQAMIRMHKELK